MPGLTGGFGLSDCTSKRRAIVASTIVASSIEKYWPMQARGPAPNGK